MTGAPLLRGSWWCYEVDGADGADWLGVEGADGLLPDVVLDWLLRAGCRPRKPMALPLGWPRLRRVR
jgi:hypothetical protein